MLARWIWQRNTFQAERLSRGQANGVTGSCGELQMVLCAWGEGGEGPEGSCVGPRTFFSVPRGAMRGWAGLFRGDYFAFWKDSPVWCGAAGQRGAPLGAVAGIRAG